MPAHRFVGLLLSLFAAGQGVAQSPMAAGARIRVLAPTAGITWPATAVVDSVGLDSLFLRELSEPPEMRRIPRVSVPFTSIVRLQVPFAGRTRWDHARTGLIWALGTYVVLATTYVILETATCSGGDCFGEGFAWIGLAGGVPVAATTGVVIGLALPVKQWQSVAVPR
jgi:hypothetical protein